MSYPINYPTPQGANVQIFGPNGDKNETTTFTWVKPQGASFVWFTLIGCGGYGDGTSGGGSGAVTNCMVPAFLIPDILRIYIAVPRSPPPTAPTSVVYQQKDGTGYTLLTAGSAQQTAAGAAMTANYFAAMGFFQSVDGEAGSSGAVSASSTTFLSVGGASASAQASNYGYTTGTTGNRSGFFQMQPIIVGAGGMGVNAAAGVGCGSGTTNFNSGAGGSGLAVIITW